MIVKQIQRQAKQFPLNPKEPYYVDRIGFWGTVKDVIAQRNAVNVLSDLGVTYRGLPVACGEWVNTEDNVKYVTGERHLPPVNARVFVLTPTGTASGAFVLCSGFAIGDTNTADFYAKDDSEDEKKANERLNVSQGGWITTENYENGNYKVLSQDGNIEINLNNVENKEENIEKKVSLKAWGTTITIKEDGISFETNKDITVNASQNNISLNCKKFSVNNTDFTVGT